jgi:hypothetical protein
MNKLDEAAKEYRYGQRVESGPEFDFKAGAAW